MKNINLNSVIHGKMAIQAEEAKELGFNKLAEDVLSALPPVPREDSEVVTYSTAELEDDLHKKLWKIALDFIKYHDLQSVDIQRVNDSLVGLKSVVTAAIENAIDSDNKVGPLEPRLPGESR